MDGASGIRYVEIQMDDDGRAEEISDKEKQGFQRQLYQYCIEFLGPHASHCVFDVSTHEKIYDIGLLYCDAFAKEQGIDGKTYLNRFLEYLIANMHQPVIMLVGKRCRISATLPDLMEMRVCSGLFRDSAQKADLLL